MISVCIGTYNGEKYILKQIKSILSQLSEEDEIVISDNGSTDRTCDIIKQIKDSRIKLYYCYKRGVTNNFENAISYAKGDHIFLSDQDDIWKENKVAEVMKDFCIGYDLVLTDCEMFNSSTNDIVEKSFFNFNNSKKGFFKNLIHNSYMGCCMAFNQKVKDMILPFPTNIPMHDSWIGLIGEYYFKVNFNKQRLIEYRIHDSNASTTGIGKSNYNLFKRIIFRYILYLNVIKRGFFND